MTTHPFSVIIPAHNEANVIARCLENLYADAPADALPEVIIVANGCSDNTAELARALAPQALVLDLKQGSKILAINEGNRVAKVTPRFILDADIITNYESLLACAEALKQDGVMAAAPTIRMKTDHCDFFVRAYYRVWLTLPYIRDALVGSGLFGLSAEGLKIVGELPDIIGDDEWIRTRFPSAQRRSVDKTASGQPAYFVVSPPSTLLTHIRVDARRRIGIAQVRSLFGNAQTDSRNQLGSVMLARQSGASLLDIGIFLGIRIMVQILTKWRKMTAQTSGWTRDERSRVQA